MTIKHAGAVFESTTTGATQRLCLLELAYRADRRGIIRASQAELAEITGLHRRTVVACFTQLESVGLLERVGHGRYKLLDAFLGDSELMEQGTEPRHIPTATERKQQQAADAELARIKSIKQPGQEIRYTRDFWPILTGPNGTRLRTEDH